MKKHLLNWSNNALINAFIIPQKNKHSSRLLIFVLSFFVLIGTDGFAQCESWTEVNDSADWSARAGLQAVSINDAFYIMGGRTPKPPSFPPIQGDSYIWNDVWKSTDFGESWTMIHDNDTSANYWPARGYFQAVTKNDSMFIIGGQNYNVIVNPFDSSLVSYSDFFDDVWASTDGVNWTEMTDSAGWAGRAGLSAAVYNNEIYVLGGSTNDDAAVIGGPPVRIYYNDVWKSADGKHWEQLTDSAAWSQRAGGIAVVKDDYLYMIGGEVGFICFPGFPCPPYFNDVWRTQNGIDWEPVTYSAPWSARPGHQVVIADDKFVLFGGFGLVPDNPFIPANPIDTWISSDGANWEQLAAPPWNAFAPTQIKYDFDALVAYDSSSEMDYIYTFGGDRETFNFADPTNHLNIDNDVWKFCANGEILATNVSSVISDSALKIYPNPITDKIQIESKSPLTSLQLFNINGGKIREYNLDNSTRSYEITNLQDLPSGGFILKVTVGEEISTFKLTKH